ncbi:MAG: UDP-N-acetylglucosamine 1-carboxyvinyltransferase [Clostridiales bacterium]|nr:UDP-N-acetylglucosamine 1-carboxyvinyltransferase [Clostridiales bacterium]
MAELTVTGGKRLRGEIAVQGAKNAALPILAATVLVPHPVRLHGCPRLLDVENMIDILRALGAVAQWQGDALLVDTGAAAGSALPEDLGRRLRSSFFLLGPLLARFGEASVSQPGGCDIGSRPIDLHLAGLKRLGAEISEDGGHIRCRGKLRGTIVHMDYPSVGATENIMMAACAANGVTVIEGAAREPEIEDLQNFLNAAGYSVSGAGLSSIVVRGGSAVQACEYTVMADRIAAGTYLAAAAATGGDIVCRNAPPRHLGVVLEKLREAGCEVREETGLIALTAPARLRQIARIDTLPHPGFPTDMQSQFLALCATARGVSLIAENVFENRLRTAAELNSMGADITVRGNIAVVRGVPRLRGNVVTAHDLRGGAALIIAALAAEGSTTLRHAERIDRGYADMEGVLNGLGAEITRNDS